MLSTLKHFDGTGMSALLESLQPHCAQRVDFSLFSVNKGHVGHGPRYHPLEPAKQGFPGRNMKPYQLRSDNFVKSTRHSYLFAKKKPENALMYELFMSKERVPFFSF